VRGELRNGKGSSFGSLAGAIVMPSVTGNSGSSTVRVIEFSPLPPLVRNLKTWRRFYADRETNERFLKAA
jgi:hypothetical protein